MRVGREGSGERVYGTLKGQNGMTLSSSCRLPNMLVACGGEPFNASSVLTFGDNLKHITSHEAK